ncbi:MAG TPA: hypothetical protein PKD76_11190 [Solirubrobacterales bacterium]|nr:hypothetical protein [Solirubrobacterales bacterium]
MLKAILTVTLIVFPWPLRRRMLNALFGYQIDSTARIGFSLVCPEKLIMEPFSRIGHFNYIRSLDEVIMEEGSIISGFNWASVNLREEVVAPRRAPTPRLVLRRYAGITARHYLDCSDEIEIGEFALVAGMRSLLMTHHLNIHEGHQTCAPIKIGAYCFVSTSCTLLGGAELPHHSVLAAGSVLIENPGTGYRLYAGVPAAEKRVYTEELGWFKRSADGVRKTRQAEMG